MELRTEAAAAPLVAGDGRVAMDGGSARELTTAQFDELLRRLGPDRDRAGRNYEQLRRRLTAVFRYRGCQWPDELADETIDRAAAKFLAMPGPAGDNPVQYFYAVAWNVAHESFRRRRTVPLDDLPEPSIPAAPQEDAQDAELERECLDRCLDALPRNVHEMVVNYYRDDGRAKITSRSFLAERLGVSPNALRIRICRITAQLRTCVGQCVDASGRDEERGV